MIKARRNECGAFRAAPGTRERNKQQWALEGQQLSSGEQQLSASKGLSRASCTSLDRWGDAFADIVRASRPGQHYAVVPPDLLKAPSGERCGELGGLPPKLGLLKDLGERMTPTFLAGVATQGVE